MSRESPSVSTQFFQRSYSVWQLALVAVIPLFSIFVGGAKPAWSLSVISASIAICLILVPSKARVSILLWLPVTLALILMFAFALPAPSVAEWRLELLRDFNIETGILNSPQPWLSFEKWLVVSCSLVWIFFCLSRNYNDHERRIILQIAVIGLTLIAGISIFYLLKEGEMPHPWTKDDGTLFRYGPFPNRNHFSGMCAIGGLLALVASYDAIKRGNKSWILFGFCLAISFTALMLNTSRFGVVMFFLGCGVWMFSAAFKDKSARKIAVFSSIFLIGATFLLIFGQKILQRFTQDGNILDSFVQSNRVTLYKDSIRLISDHPWLGWGLGNFEPVYALVGRYSDHYYRVSHPENDYFWFVLEAGLPAAVCLIFALVVLVVHSGPWRVTKEKYGRRDRRLRQASAIAAIMFAAQGLIDVPLHSLGIAVIAGTLAGLGYDNQRLVPNSKKQLPFLSYTAALGLFCASIMWALVEKGSPIFPTDTYARKLKVQSQAYINEGRNAEALEVTEKILTILPLDWRFYHQRAQLKLWLGYPANMVLSDFARARRLEPDISSVAESEAATWTSSQYPRFAISAYHEAINRNSNNAHQYFGSILELGRQHPELNRTIREVAHTKPKLHLQYALSRTGNSFTEELKSLLEREPELKVFKTDEQLQLFWYWYSHGDRQALLQQLEDKPQWQTIGWIILATDQAQQGKFKEACIIAFEHIPPPFGTQLPPNSDIEQLSRLYLVNPTDIARGLQLFEAQKADGKFSDALKTLDEVAALPSSPNKVQYERAAMLQKLGEYAKAWEALQMYVKQEKS